MRPISTALNALAFLWVAAATIYLLVGSGYGGVDSTTGLSGSEDVVGSLDVSLFSASGVWIVGLLMGVTLIAGLPFGVALTHPEGHRPVTWSAGLLLLGFSVISGFSVGLMYLPGAVVLLSSAVTARVRGERRPAAEDRVGAG